MCVCMSESRDGEIQKGQNSIHVHLEVQEVEWPIMQYNETLQPLHRNRTKVNLSRVSRKKISTALKMKKAVGLHTLHSVIN